MNNAGAASDHEAAARTNRALRGPVIVTGGSSGLGAAVVRAVTRRGGSCVVLDLRRPAPGVPWLKVDLSDPHASAIAAIEAQSIAGPPTGVVTAAGIDSYGRLEDIDFEEWFRVVAINLLGTVAVVRASLPGLRGTGGRVVTVASTLGGTVSDATAYYASEFAIVGFTRALAAETAGEVGVTLLVPGGMRTSFFDDRPAEHRPRADTRLAEPDDIGEMVAFALSQPPGIDLRELVACSSYDRSWP